MLTIFLEKNWKKNLDFNIVRKSNREKIELCQNYPHRTLLSPTELRVDGGPEFRGPFKEMLEEFKIPYTLSLPYIALPMGWQNDMLV